MKRQAVTPTVPARTYMELSPRVAEPVSAPLSASRTRITRMSHDELMVEFISLVSDTAGTEMDLQEAQDAKFLMETLRAKVRNAVFRAQLDTSLRVLNQEIARLMN